MSAGSHKCPICSESFDTMYSLHFHCIEKHPRRFVCCPICFEPLENHQSNRYLVEHSNVFHQRETKIEYNSVDYAPNAPYRFGDRMVQGKSCVVCSKHFVSHINATLHFRQVHLGVKYLCHRCDQTLTESRALKRHNSTMHGQGSKTESADHAESRATECMNVKMFYKPQAMPKKRRAIRTGIKIFRCRTTRSNPGGLSCTILGTEHKSTNCAGFEMSDKINAEEALKSRLSAEKRWRAKSATGAGIKFLDDVCDYFPNFRMPLIPLTFLTAKGAVKLRPFAMNDMLNDFDLTTNDA